MPQLAVCTRYVPPCGRPMPSALVLNPFSVEQLGRTKPLCQKVSCMRIAMAFIVASHLMEASVCAGTISFQCSINEQLFIGDDGSAKRPPSPWLIGSKFAIDRKSGSILGPEKSMWSFADSVYTVVASGNSDSSFIVIASSAARGGGVHFTAINVQEFLSGPNKPFTAISGGALYSGICQ